MNDTQNYPGKAIHRQFYELPIKTALADTLMRLEANSRGSHRDCVWNCGSTDCPAPPGNYRLDKKRAALRNIKKQPFFRGSRP